jgi:hypothetical protein
MLDGKHTEEKASFLGSSEETTDETDMHHSTNGTVEALL